MMNDNSEDNRNKMEEQDLELESPDEAPQSVQDYLSDRSVVAYAGIIVSAIILTIALAGAHSGHQYHRHYRYGLWLVSIAMILSVMGAFVAIQKKAGTEQVLLYNNYVLFVWNLIGAGFLTFDGPFYDTGNGYFAAWGLVVFGAMALGVNMAALQRMRNATTGAAAILLACAIVVLTAISVHGIKKGDINFSEMVYGLLLCLFTISVTGFILNTGDATQAFQLYIFGIMSLLWSVAAGLLTFRGPFLITGNGYFGLWGACIASLYGANRARY